MNNKPVPANPLPTLVERFINTARGLLERAQSIKDAVWGAWERRVCGIAVTISETPTAPQPRPTFEISSKLTPVLVEFKLRGSPPSGSKWGGYAKNLEAVSCACEEFTKRRHKFAVNDVRRLCLHLLNAYEKAGIWSEQEEIVTALLQSGPIGSAAWTYHSIYKAQLASGSDIFFGTQTNRPWVDVYTRKRKPGEKGGYFTGAYDRFGFNLITKEWAYGYAPPAARETRKLIDAAFHARTL
jgi:hypothetical protein